MIYTKYKIQLSMLRFLFTILTLSPSLSYFAQTLDIFVSSDSVLIGNYIELTFTVKNTEGQFELPTLSDMDIISGPNTSNTVQIINGEKTSKTTYSYYVKPTTTGSITIPPAYIIRKDNSLETAPRLINVYPNPENIIINPESKDQSSFFELRDWESFGSQPSRPTPPTVPSKPKRKYKKI